VVRPAGGRASLNGESSAALVLLLPWNALLAIALGRVGVVRTLVVSAAMAAMTAPHFLLPLVREWASRLT
jgi:hypothetical protein